MKFNPLPGETKGISILDIGKLSDRFGKELTLSFSQWSEAAKNMFDFQQQRDKKGEDGQHSAWYNDHFNFFNGQHKKNELYDAWKSVELEFCQEHLSVYDEFELKDYVDAFKACEGAAKLKAEMQDLFMSQGNKFSLYSSHESGTYPNKLLPKFPLRRSSDRANPQSFPSGSRRSPSTSNCLICSERGHNSFQHLNSTTLVKFLNGKATWVKCSSRGLVTPDNRQLCINWNVRGERALPQCSQQHNKDDRAHMCSFCGSKGHNAFSWTCLANPSNT